LNIIHLWFFLSHFTYFFTDLIVDLIYFMQDLIYMHSLFIIIKGKEGFKHTRFHHERDAEGCTTSRTPELRERILLSATKLSSLSLEEMRSLQERDCHCCGERILPMIYIARRNPSSTHYRSRPLIYNTSSTRIDESHILI